MGERGRLYWWVRMAHGRVSSKPCIVVLRGPNATIKCVRGRGRRQHMRIPDIYGVGSLTDKHILMRTRARLNGSVRKSAETDEDK